MTNRLESVAEVVDETAPLFDVVPVYGPSAACAGVGSSRVTPAVRSSLAA
jgi:hypothetical protein